MKVNCAFCNKELERRPCRAKGRNYCNAICQNSYEYGHGIKDKFDLTKKANEEKRREGLEKFKTNPAMKLGKRGYLLIYVPKGTDEWKKGWRYYHHWVWEKATGKRIEKGFCIHHKDRNPKNNNIENLQYMTIAEHDRLKCKERKELTKSI